LISYDHPIKRFKLISINNKKMKTFSQLTPKQKYTASGVALATVIFGYYAYNNGYMKNILKKKNTESVEIKKTK
jgi:hypothetical protein